MRVTALSRKLVIIPSAQRSMSAIISSMNVIDSCEIARCRTLRGNASTLVVVAISTFDSVEIKYVVSVLFNSDANTNTNCPAADFSAVLDRRTLYPYL